MSIQHLRRLICALLIASAALLAGCSSSNPPAGATAAPGGQSIPYPAYQPPSTNARPTP